MCFLNLIIFYQLSTFLHTTVDLKIIREKSEYSPRQQKFVKLFFVYNFFSHLHPILAQIHNEKTNDLSNKTYSINFKLIVNFNQS